MLNHLDRSTERSVLQTLEDQGPALEEEIFRRMFLFEDLATVENRCIQRILREA